MKEKGSENGREKKEEVKSVAKGNKGKKKCGKRDQRRVVDK